MATFLTTPRMSPELRARVERAVSPKARARHRAAYVGMSGTFAGRSRLGWARALPLLAAGGVAGLAIAGYAYDRRAVEAERGAILQALDARSAALPAGHERLLATIEPLIVGAARAREPGDVVDPSLRGALDAALRRPALYVHGAAADLGDPQKIGLAARASDKDGFLLCLFDPPPSASEHDRLVKVRGVYFAGAKLDADTARVRRVAEARTALALTGPAFENRVREATDFPTLHRLRKDLEASPLELARQAASAELLLVVADTPAEPSRVTLVDLATGKILLRVRRKVHDLGTSAAAALHREQLEGCDLALSVRASTE